MHLEEWILEDVENDGVSKWTLKEAEVAYGGRIPVRNLVAHASL